MSPSGADMNKNTSQICIVGAGLIGSSVGLGLKESGFKVNFLDLSPVSQRIANQLVGLAEEYAFQFLGSDLIFLVATPPEEVFKTLLQLNSQHPEAKFIEVSGIKSKLVFELEDFPDIRKRLCMVHPMAGREFSGVEAARSDLFQGKPWLIVENQDEFSQERKSITEIASDIGKYLGSEVSILDIQEHDLAITLVSQMPQLLASTLANQILENPSSAKFAGQGLRDMIRIADSSSTLWSNLFARNKEFLVKEINSFIDKLTKAKNYLADDNLKEIEHFIASGKEGKLLVPGKHGGALRDYSYIAVVIDDKPGQLAGIFQDCGEAEINIEDITIEHSPGQQTGLIKLAVAPSSAEKLQQHLATKNWKAHLLNQ